MIFFKIIFCSELFLNLLITSIIKGVFEKYRNGQDSNGWHSDNEKELGENPTIASVSFGDERYFNMKHRENKSFKLKLLLKNGSVFIMSGETQEYWLHQIPKTNKNVGPRINLTFRKIN